MADGPFGWRELKQFRGQAGDFLFLLIPVWDADAVGKARGCVLPPFTNSPMVFFFGGGVAQQVASLHPTSDPAGALLLLPAHLHPSSVSIASLGPGTVQRFWESA